MKKLMIIAAALMLCCCTGTSEGQRPISVKHINGGGASLDLIEVTIDGETHEYLMYRAGYYGGISHWEGCRYCKEKSN